MQEELSMRELCRYYIDRYEIVSNKSEEDAFYLVNVAITRILKSTKISEDGKSLWEALNSKEKPSVRKISIEKFEKLCFEKWAKYIEKNHPYCTQNHYFIEDKEKHLEIVDNDFWKRVAEKMMNENDSSYENESEEQIDEGTTLIELEKTGHMMMIEALYDIFYGPFNWKQLQKDLNSKPDVIGFGTEVSPSEARALTMLSNFHNYIGKRKYGKK